LIKFKEDTANENWKLVLSKTFDFLLPFSTSLGCRVITQDVIDVIVSNQKNKKKSPLASVRSEALKTQHNTAENFIIDCK
jgi:hypothetical protein